MLTLGRELAKISEVYVAAPTVEKSGASHSMTGNIPIRVYRQKLPGITDHAWAIEGTPTDCAKLALSELMPELPDIVISGINHGANLGTDVIYSGTVGAATEGYCYGCSAIAVSVTGNGMVKDVGNFAYAAEFTKKLCLEMSARDFQPRMFLNVNVPGRTPDEVRGVKYTYMGWRWYKDPFTKRVDPRGKEYYWLQGQFDDTGCGVGSDVEACADGYISVTPLHLDQTDYEALSALHKTNLFSF